jgi:prevent-host-death family protein
MYRLSKFLYIISMTEVTITGARADLAKTIKRAKKGPIKITSHGEPQAVLVDPSLFEKMLEALEDAEDLAAFDAALKDSDPGIPWEQAKKDLGI